MDGRRFRVNTPEVVHQTIDGEVVIINLTHGYYYSLTETAADVWGAIGSGAAASAIVETIARSYAGGRTEIAADVERLLGELEREALIVEDVSLPRADKTGVEANTAGTAAPASGQAGVLRPFTPPVLQKYADMQELLLLDPIHEVDETGWPAKTGERDGDD
jgi:hypothetical protein